MDARVNDKTRLPSRHVTEGPERAPHRSYYYAMGLTARADPPALRRRRDLLERGRALQHRADAPGPGGEEGRGRAPAARRASSAPSPSPTASPWATQGMKSSLPSREVIADSVELTMRGHGYDALVGIAGCDKSLPGMMMAMCRLNVPSIFIYGGSILPGTFKGRPVTVQDVFEAVGQHSVGDMSDADLDELEQVACPSAGACGAQFTANTMATVSEAIGLALPYSAGAPAPYEIRDRFCLTAGRDGDGADRAATSARATSSPCKALENAATVVAASGGSTNAALHLPAIAHECGIKFDLFDVAEIFKRTPYIADLKPGGRYVAKDMFEAGGIPLLMKTLLDARLPARRLHDGDRPHDRREPRQASRWNADQDVVRPADKPITADRRRRRPERQPRAGRRDREGRRHAADTQISRGPARCFDGEEACFEAVSKPHLQGRRGPRHPLRGPAAAAPACARCCRRRRRSTARAWATRSRSSPTGASPARRAASASAMSGRRRRSAGRSRSLRDGDIIAHRRRQGHASRWSSRTTSSPSAGRHGSRGKRLRARAISGNTRSRSAPARDGAVTHPGGAAEKHSYADI